ncbi:MAG: PPOX class F420-dependent oxidoreductase [Ktedonobacteraceae bacterium]|nr:PPOX class F420-dependent oxidoreductase [Ktedonobacteraceae bacterium]
MTSQISPFEPLLKENYASLTTFRKSGVGVATPTWFAESNGIIYIYTDADSGKVKRIRNSGRVTLATCTAIGKVTGEAIEGKARIVGDQQEIERAEAALMKKYGLQRRLLYLFRRVAISLRRGVYERVYLAIEA